MDKRSHIITHAIQLFAEFGFDNTSIRELAKKAGVNIAMINYYFGSKEKLFAAVIEYKSSYLKTRLEELRMDQGMDEMEKIQVIIAEFVRRIMANPHFHRILHQELLLTSRPEVAQSVRNLVSRNYQVINSILEDGIRKNVFRNVDTGLTISTVMGTINHFLQSNPILFNKDETQLGAARDLQADRLIKYLQDLMRAHLAKEHSS